MDFNKNLFYISKIQKNEYATKSLYFYFWLFFFFFSVILL